VDAITGLKGFHQVKTFKSHLGDSPATPCPDLVKLQAPDSIDGDSRRGRDPRGGILLAGPDVAPLNADATNGVASATFRVATQEASQDH
jgi:hypothetical protein